MLGSTTRKRAAVFAIEPVEERSRRLSCYAG